MKFRNYKIRLLFLILISFTSCKVDKKTIPQDLVKLTEEQLIERAKQKKIIDLKKVIYKNESGEIVSKDAANKLLSTGEWAFDRYANSNGVVKELRLRKFTEEDKTFNKKLMEAYQYKPHVKIIDIDCSDIVNILDEVYDLDQNLRKSGSQDYEKHDAQNLITVVSLIEKCGMPTLNKVNQKQMNAIWYVFQHSDHLNRKRYFTHIQEAARQGDLSNSKVAIMQDRIMMFDGEEQIYGSQIIKNPETKKFELYKLKEPETVNQRRKEVGLEPIHEYLKKWNIKFEVEQIE